MKCQIFADENKNKNRDDYTHLNVNNIEVQDIPNHSIDEILIGDTLSYLEESVAHKVISYVALKLRKEGKAIFEDTDLDELCKQVVDHRNSEMFNATIKDKKTILPCNTVMQSLRKNNLSIISTVLEDTNYIIVATKI